MSGHPPLLFLYVRFIHGNALSKIWLARKYENLVTLRLAVSPDYGSLGGLLVVGPGGPPFGWVSLRTFFIDSPRQVGKQPDLQLPLTSVPFALLPS